MVTLVNRAKMSTASTGTGSPITLGSAESGYQSFADAGVADGNVVRYVIEDGNAWEIGTGTYTASGTTLTRTVLESSNADAALNLTGSAVVYVSAAAEDIQAPLELYAENPSTPTTPIATGANAVAIGTQSEALGTSSVAIGEDCVAGSGTFRAVAIGSNSFAYGNDSTVLGAIAQASSNESTAIGYRAQTFAGAGAVAIGESRAAGADSLAAAIASNSSAYGATGANSVAMGRQSKATAIYATAIGNSNTASQGDGASAIGSTNTASGLGSLAQGYLNFASGSYSQAFGFGASTQGIYGKLAKQSGYFSNFADAQYGLLVLRSDTTTATPEALTTNNSTAGTTNQIILPNNSAYSFSGTIIARQQASAGSDYASWEIKGALLRDGSAATTVLGNGIVNKLYATAGASAWAVALTADTTNGGLAITVTGAAATNIRWVATVNTSEVTY